MQSKFLAVSLIVVHLILLVNLRFTPWPEMVLWPYLINSGLIPYKDTAIAHFPALLFLLSWYYKLIGFSLLNLKVFTWVFIVLLDVCIYLIAKKLFNKTIATVSLCFFALWQPYFEGNGMWFDLFTTMFLLLTFYLISQKKYILTGLVFGIAILGKQTAIYAAIPIIITLILQKQFKIKNIIKTLGGLLIPVGLFCIYLVKNNILADFYFWAIKFGIGYLPSAEGQIKLPSLKQTVALGVPFISIIYPLILIYKNKFNKQNQLTILLLVWSLFLLLGTYPRFEYFHLQPSLPFLAILSGVTIAVVFKQIHKNRLFLAPLILILMGSTYLTMRFYLLNWHRQDRFFEPETKTMATWLSTNANYKEKIFILNSWDHLYALSDTIPAVTPWVPTLPWYMNYPDIQDKIVLDLIKNKPEIIVFEPYKYSGLGSYKPEKINAFLENNYQHTLTIAQRFWVLEPK